MKAHTYKDEPNSVHSFYVGELDANVGSFNIEYFIEDVLSLYGKREADAVQFVDEWDAWGDYGCDNRDFVAYVEAFKKNNGIK